MQLRGRHWPVMARPTPGGATVPPVPMRPTNGLIGKTAWIEPATLNLVLVAISARSRLHRTRIDVGLSVLAPQQQATQAVHLVAHHAVDPPGFDIRA